MSLRRLQLVVLAFLQDRVRAFMKAPADVFAKAPTCVGSFAGVDVFWEGRGRMEWLLREHTLLNRTKTSAEAFAKAPTFFIFARKLQFMFS